MAAMTGGASAMETGAAAPKSTAVGTEEIDFAVEAENRGMELVSSTRVSCAEFKCLLERRGSFYLSVPVCNQQTSFRTPLPIDHCLRVALTSLTRSLWQHSR